MKKIQIVPLRRIEEMREMLNEYLTELSQFDPMIKFDEKGTPIYKWFDCYWVDKDRYPIYLIIDGTPAGLALIRELDDMVYDFAEFYVDPKFRKDGNAIWFANEIVSLFEGEFTFSTRHTNPRAIAFWNKFAKQYGSGEYEDDETWRNWKIRPLEKREHTLKLNPEYFALIASGEKTLEGRLNDDKRKTIKEGDIINFLKEPNLDESLKAVVLKRYIYTSFDEMANDLDKSQLGFAAKTKQQMIDTYRTFYSREEETKYGVVIFKIKVI